MGQVSRRRAGAFVLVLLCLVIPTSADTLPGFGRQEGAGPMRITTKGQVTIPQHIRERLGLLPHTDVDLTLEGDVAYLRKVDPDEAQQAQQRQQGAEASSRSEILIRLMERPSAITMSTDEILALTSCLL